MKLQSLKCPNCDAALEVEGGIDTFFCKYCGYKIVLTGMSDASYNAKVQMKAMEHQERMQDKKYEQERYKIDKKEQSKKNEAKKGAIVTGLIVLACVLYFISMGNYFDNEEQKSLAQEAELQEIVDEVLVDIENGDFEEAYAKANTIHYTENWSDEIEEKWDDTREALIEQIKKAEKEANGGGGFFDWFD